jgi:hypothetical protein
MSILKSSWTVTFIIFKGGTEVMNKEAEVAAKWWADILKQEDIHDNGEPIGSYLANLGLSNLKPLSDEVVNNFRSALVTWLDEAIEDNKCAGNWRESEPRFCSYFRAGWLNIDYNVHGILKNLALSVGIPEKELMFRFPIKTIMWVNPGEVEVRHGYGAGVEKLL